MTIKAAFLDRDGVINHDTGYVYKIDDFQFIEGVVDALKKLQEQGYALIIVTNQSGIGRGYYTEADYQTLTAYYREQLMEQSISLLDVFHCPSTPSDNSEYRKPKPGMLLQAIEKYAIDIEASIMFGDKLTDMQAAAAAGIKHGFFITENNQPVKTNPLIKITTAPSLWHCVTQGKIA